MSKKRGWPAEHTTFSGTNFIREVSYLHQDEALAERAKAERTSKSEMIRWAL